MIGVSGGLDSTQALIVACKAMDRLGRPRSDVLAFTMPGFATGETTKAYATRLAEALGVTFEELDIRPAAEQMLADLGHPYADGEKVYDVTFENVQAGLRYDYLFRLANQRGGIVVGTGDLSELALGWCTYGVGDQMSHYTVNAGVPKTLVQHLIRWVISHGEFEEAVGGVLAEILQQEITPELIPTEDGKKPQATEDTVGPYNLQDFTLAHVVRHGYRPRKIAFLAWHAWQDADAGEWPPGFPDDARVAYDLPTVRRWLEVFVQALLRQPVQALRAAQRPQGQCHRHDEPARRLADAERREGHRLAGRDRAGRAAASEAGCNQPVREMRPARVRLLHGEMTMTVRTTLSHRAGAPPRVRRPRRRRARAVRRSQRGAEAHRAAEPRTRLTFTVDGLRGLRDPARQRAPALGDADASTSGSRAPGPSSDGTVTFRVATLRTWGMSATVVAPWEGHTGYVTTVAWRYNGERVGDTGHPRGGRDPARGPPPAGRAYVVARSPCPSSSRRSRCGGVHGRVPGSIAFVPTTQSWLGHDARGVGRRARLAGRERLPLTDGEVAKRGSCRAGPPPPLGTGDRGAWFRHARALAAQPAATRSLLNRRRRARCSTGGGAGPRRCQRGRRR